MEATTNTPTDKPNYRQFNDKNDQHFYAAYLNTAVQNVFIVLKDISDHLQLTFVKEDTRLTSGAVEVWSKLENNDEPEVSLKIIDRLKKQFSFTQLLAENNVTNRTNRKAIQPMPEDYHQVFLVWIKQLVDHRNQYSHAIAEPAELNAYVLEGMRHLYDADWKRFKDIKGFKDEDVEHLVRRGKNGERHGFNHGFEKQGKTSEHGFLYFLCLWLEKREAQEVLKKHYGFKSSRTISEKATLEMFTRYRIRLPKPRLVSDNSDEALFMDMLNELQRCPKPLYQHIHANDRETFITKAPLEADGLESEEGSKLTRNQNRFYYFALRYLEKNFDHLKFQVDLGTYCFKTYDKNIGERTVKRRWFKKILDFGNLTDYDAEGRPDEWKKLIWDPKEGKKPDTYISDTYPHYHFDTSSDVMNIIVKRVAGFDKPTLWPDFTYKNEQYCLSLYALPGIAFYEYLRGQYPDKDKLSAEQVIEAYRERNHSFLKAVAYGDITAGFDKKELEELLEMRGLSLQQVPKAVINYLLEKKGKSFEQKARKRLEDMVGENGELLSRVQRQTPHYKKYAGSKDHVRLKAGDMADFLARDMINLQKPINGDKGKANSTLFQLLQAELAFYSLNSDGMAERFKHCQLTDSENQHPFLSKMNAKAFKSVLEFYTDYLIRRGAYLQTCLDRAAYSEYHFLKLKQVPVAIKELIKRQREAIMNLPRNLFDKPVADSLRRLPEMRTWLKDSGNARVNISFMIQTYLKLVRHDHHQVFYNAKRNYEILDKLCDNPKKRGRKPIREQFFSTTELVEQKDFFKESIEKKPEEDIRKNKIIEPDQKVRVKRKYTKAYRNFTENEKQIRLYKTCDTALMLMAEDLYQKQLSDQTTEAKIKVTDAFKLKEVTPNAEKGILATQRKTAVSVGKRGREVFRIEHPSLKVKNYGDFRAFLKDRRIESLLPYLKEKTIQYEPLKLELEMYSKARMGIWEAILDFENAAIAHLSLTVNEEGYIAHKPILDQALAEWEETKIKRMNEIRNAVAHGTYPKKEFSHLKGKADLNQLNREMDSIGYSAIYQIKEEALLLYSEAKNEILRNKKEF